MLTARTARTGPSPPVQTPPERTGPLRVATSSAALFTSTTALPRDGRGVGTPHVKPAQIARVTRLTSASAAVPGRSSHGK